MVSKPATAFAIAAALLSAAGVPPTGGGQSHQEAAGGPPEPTLFLAPFTPVSFLEAVFEESERRRILQERISGVFIDEKRALVWTADDNGVDIDWKRANDYCAHLDFASFDDWRLPSLQELETLLRPLSRKQYSTPEQINLTACCPWSTTKKDQVAAWNFNFKFRKPFSGSMTHTYDLRALCVRALRDSDGLPEDPELLLDDPEVGEPDTGPGQ